MPDLANSRLVTCAACGYPPLLSIVDFNANARRSNEPMPTCRTINEWCFANEGYRRCCALFLPYVVYEWCADWIARSRPDSRYTATHWPRCTTV